MSSYPRHLPTLTLFNPICTVQIPVSCQTSVNTATHLPKRRSKPPNHRSPRPVVSRRRPSTVQPDAEPSVRPRNEAQHQRRGASGDHSMESPGGQLEPDSAGTWSPRTRRPRRLDMRSGTSCIRENGGRMEGWAVWSCSSEVWQGTCTYDVIMSNPRSECHWAIFRC